MQSKLNWSEVSEKVCEDQAEFNKYFIPGRSKLDSVKLRKLVCDLNINVTILMEELPGAVEGMDKLINEVGSDL